jgi:predicted phage tail protein
MSLVYIYSDPEEGLKAKEYPIKFSSLQAALLCLEEEHPEIFNLFSKTKYSIVLQKNAESEPFAWQQDQNFESFDFERIFFIEAVEGKFVISAIAGALVAIGVTGSIAGVAVATIIATIIVDVVLAIALGAIMQALAPTQTNEAGAQARVNLTFSSQDNIGTQGSAIPLIFGEALATGVVIGRRTEVHDMIITDNFAAPTIPSAVPTIQKVDLPTAPVGVWRKLKN